MDNVKEFISQFVFIKEECQQLFFFSSQAFQTFLCIEG